MASRLIHLAVTEGLIVRRGLADAERLRFGSILPDAVGTRRESGVAHFKITLCSGSRRTYDLTAFRELFGERMRADCLYLGYYLHLIQDMSFRNYLYVLHRWDPTPPGNVARLHSDYLLLNRHVAGRYGLRDGLTLPDGFGSEPLNRIAKYLPGKLLEALRADFLPAEAEPGKSFFFTSEMADEYISLSTELCLKELDALERGGSCFDEREWSWKTAAPR